MLERASEPGLVRRVVRSLRKRVFPGSTAYWNRRYRFGGTSGPGSYGEYATFKAQFLNQLVAVNQITEVVEFGCGDGNQLALARYPHYLGLDVSPRAIKMCKSRFGDDGTKQFQLYEPTAFVPRQLGDLALSLDVVLHLVEDEVFDLHLEHLFSAARRMVVIYGSDIDPDAAPSAAHVRWRRFTPIIERDFPEWTLESVTEGVVPASTFVPRTDFFVYRRI